jgi:hypothetical protein
MKCIGAIKKLVAGINHPLSITLNQSSGRILNSPEKKADSI